jgi:hypothetical protein
MYITTNKSDVAITFTKSGAKVHFFQCLTK